MSTLLNGCLADTDYLEVTAKSGHTYGVWVTTPVGYSDASEPMPLVYVLDGNWTVGLTAPLIVVQADPYLTIAPYIQVTVGYAGDEAANWAQLRNRDLVPAGEPVSRHLVDALQAGVDAGAMTQEGMDAYLAELADSHADVFLDFLTHELHPQLKDQYRVSDAGHGLFGYSYGGLFAFYAWLVTATGDATPFATVGAGSPGVTGTDSQVFELIRKLPERDAEADNPRLHVTVNQRELLGAVPVYREIARTALAAVEELHLRGRSEDLSTDLLHGTHLTGLQASFLSYLEACHAR
jgi:predicted alpha/beta superfamily hydrolase